MANKDFKHFDNEVYKKEHENSKTRGCIYGHESIYKENNRCSYRWQAYNQAEEDKHNGS